MAVLFIARQFESDSLDRRRIRKNKATWCGGRKTSFGIMVIHSAGRNKAKNAKPPAKEKVDAMVEWRTRLHH